MECGRGGQAHESNRGLRDAARPESNAVKHNFLWPQMLHICAFFTCNGQIKQLCYNFIVEKRKTKENIYRVQYVDYIRSENERSILK